MDKRYDIIYADPPWRYDFAPTSAENIDAHYNSMSLEEIKNLKVPSKENCILYLWATAPKIIEALEVMEAWGFKYKTQGMWDKGYPGLGYWFLGQHEILLVGTKGKMSPPDPWCRIGSIFKERKNKKVHSQKPKCVRKWIEFAFAHFHDKLEMFARENHEHWDVFGNEVEGSINL